MKIMELNGDATRQRFIPFALKGNATKLLYSMPTNSISMQDEFVKPFLKKFYPIYKTVWVKNESILTNSRRIFLEIFRSI